MSASKLAEYKLNFAQRCELSKILEIALDEDSLARAVSAIIAARDEMALRVFEETRERAAKIAADAIAPNRRDIADAIRAMQPK